MGFRNTTTGWGWMARLLHWSIAAIILFMLGLGVYMTQIVTDVFEQFPLFQTHKSWGFVVFVLALIRVIWRLMNPAPALPDHMSGLERLGAHVGHWALYALMFALPLSGWLMSSASPLQDLYGIKNMVFGLFEMPDPFVPGDGDIEGLFKTVHYWCGWALAAVLAAHAGAALKHHFVNRDNVLRRMVKGE